MPKKLRTWLAAMRMAAPAVKPITTVCEMKLTSTPMRASPSTSWKTPTRKVSVSTRLDVLRRAGFGLVRERGEDGDRDRGGRAGNEVPAGAEQRGDDRRHHGGVEAVLRRQAGDGGEGDALRQDDQRAGEAGDQVVAQCLPTYQRPPLKEGKPSCKQGVTMEAHGGESKG